MSIRTSITKTDVVTAANALLAEGINPSANKVREKLGKGSFSTIQNFLEEWRQTPEVVFNGVPQEIHDYLATIAADLWRRAQETANAVIETEREELRHEREVLMKEVDKALIKSEVVQERVVEVEAELKQALREGTRYRQELANANNDVSTLRKEAQRAEERMDELETTNERLYRQMAEKERILAEVTATEKMLRVSNEDAREQSARDKATLERVNKQLDHLAAVNRETINQRDEAVAAASAAKEDKADALHRLELVEQRHRDGQKRYDKLNKIYTEVLAKAAYNDTLTQQLNDANALAESFQTEQNDLQRKYAEQTGQLNALITELRHAQRTLYQRGIEPHQE